MAWSSAELSSDEIAWAAADKPMLVAQAIPPIPLYALWAAQGDTGSGNITTWTDRADSDYPSRRVYDGLPHLISKPGTSPTDDYWFFCMQFSTPIDFDCAFMLSHNMGTLDLDDLVGVQVADDNDYSTNLNQVANWGAPTDDTRLADLEIYHTGSVARRYTDVEFMRVRIDNAAGAPGANIIPEIGYLCLGRRCQMPYLPDRPYYEKPLRTERASVTSMSGVRHTTQYYKNQFVLDASWSRIDESAVITELETFIDTVGDQFIWVPEPNSNPTNFYLMNLDEETLSLPRVGPDVHSFRIAGFEQGPEEFFLQEES